MEFDRANTIFFLGIGGIGMSALARHFHSIGKKVCGYDKTPSALTRSLQEEGIEIWFEDNPNIVPAETQLVVYTPAVPRETELYRFFTLKGIPIIKRAEMLGKLVSGKKTIAVAGTHGKTTISAMIAHILKCAGVKTTAFLGGISTNYNSNYLSDEGAQWAIAEADEYDRSFLHLKPDIALVSSLDADHLDIFGTKNEMVKSFQMFVSGIRQGGKLVVNKAVEPLLNFEGHTYTYSLNPPSDLYSKNIAIASGVQETTLSGALTSGKITLGLPGSHNLENAIGAAMVAHLVGVPSETIKRGLSQFKGVKRRFEKCFESKKTVYIDDYAHHPEEIRACINACRELYPGKQITAIFQPHLYSRTRDLAKQFASSLALADRLIVMEIYPAREAPIPDINSSWLLQQIPTENKQIAGTDDILEIVEKQEHEILLTMGAGDIDRIVPEITERLRRREE